MSYKVLARKWRPQVFQDVIGQEHITQTLTNAIKSDRLAHAYLFGGPRGIGKTSVARILAKAINCREGDPGVPCNQCRSCVEITDGTSTDVQEIDGASNRGIDEIRSLRENVKYMPASSDYRIYIIDEVHMLTLPAFNALLKTLEEPPAHVKFIFATTETHKVPMTILSRCQRFDFKKIPPGLIVSHLERILKEEKVRIGRAGLALIAQEADGCMRDAQSLLDQVISFAGEKAEDHHVREILGIIDQNVVFDTCRAVIENSPGRCFEIVDQIYNYGHDIKEFYRALMGLFRNLLVIGLDFPDQCHGAGEHEKARLKELAAQAGPEKLRMLLSHVVSREQDLRFSSDPRLMLETVLIRLCSLGDYLSFGELMSRMEAMEKRLLNASAGVRPVRENHIADPEGPWSSNTVAAPPEPDELRSATDDTDGNDKGWDELLDYIKTKSRSMFSVLKAFSFLALSGDSLEIAKGDQSFSAGFFDHKENLEQLLMYCREFFGRDIRLAIRPNQKTGVNGKGEAGNHAPEPKPKDSDDLPQPVREVLRVFQGEIKS